MPTPPPGPPHPAEPQPAQPGDEHRELSHDGDLSTPRGSTGILLCHGFTGSPASMRPWAQQLIEAGFTVRLPLLPGHGTHWRDANRTTFADWLATDTAALQELARRCRRVLVFGLSMGGTLALRMAQLYPEMVSGLVLVNPSVLSRRRELAVLPVLKHLVAGVKAIGDDIALPGVTEHAYPMTPLKALDSLRRAWPLVRAGLPQVSAPLLLLHSPQDHVVEPENSAVILASVGSADVTEIVLENSYHVATLDGDAQLIVDASIEFADRITARDRT